jgi:soluble cytochrome b562
MSISAISSNTNFYQIGSIQKKPQQEQSYFDQLAQALQSGDLSAAQQLFLALQQTLSSSSAGSQTQTGQNGSGQDPFMADINALSQGLQSGDLSAAQQAFAKLQQGMQSAPPPPPMGTDASQDSTSEATKFQQLQSYIGQLAQALDSGDLSAAQQAFATLQQDMQSTGTDASQNSTSEASSAQTKSQQLQSYVEQLAQALQSGDLSAAQQAFATLQQGMQSAPPPPPMMGADASQDSTSRTSSAQAKFQQLQSYFDQLSQDLQSGDLSAAQQAFAALQQLLPSSSTDSQTQTEQQGSGQDPFATDVNALGQALGSGDLSAAQQAFATLQQGMQSAPPPPPMMGADASQDSTSEASSAQAKFQQLENYLLAALSTFSSVDESSSSQSVGNTVSVTT